MQIYYLWFVITTDVLQLYSAATWYYDLYVEFLDLMESYE